MKPTIGEVVVARIDVHLDGTLSVPVGTTGVVAYTIDEDDDAVGIQWDTTPPQTIEVAMRHLGVKHGGSDQD